MPFLSEETQLPAATPWRKSSYSDSTACVEIAFRADEILVRDSKYLKDESSDPATQPILRFNQREWSAFLAGVRAGEFDSAD